MAVNPALTQLDTSQAIKRTFDESNDAIRTVPAAATSFSIELDAADGDSVKVSDGTDTLAVNADGSINSVVAAVDLDIRNLVAATDKVSVEPGVSPLVVSASNLDIRDLVAATDNVMIVGTEDGLTSGTRHVIKLDANGVQFIRADSISVASAALSSASTSVILGPTSSSGIKSYQIYAQVTAEDVPAAGITGNITARLDISPFTSGSNFYETATTLNVPATTALDAVVVSSLLSNIIGQRAQLTLTANNLAGSDAVVFYLVGSST